MPNGTYQLRNFIFKVVIQNFGSHDEQIFDVFARHRGGLEMEVDVLLTLKLLYPIEADLSLVLHVELVSDQEKDHVGLTLVHDLIIPRVQIVEGLEPGDVVG